MAKRATNEAGDWSSSLRFSAFTVINIALVVIGAFAISPILSTFVQQQRQISELRESVKQHREAVNEIDAERAKWKDPVYVRSQARGRLFYVMPGETQLSVISDVVLPPERTDGTSSKLTRIDRNWAKSLVSSTLGAGTTAATPEQLSPDAREQQKSGTGSKQTAPSPTDKATKAPDTQEKQAP